MRRFDVSLGYVDAFREFAEIHGIAASTTEQVCPGAFVRRVQGSEFCGLVEKAVGQSGDRDLGFRFGAALGGRGFGLLGIAGAVAPTLAQSLTSLKRWEPLTRTLGETSITREHRQVRIRWVPHQAVPAAVVEGILSGWVAFGSFLAGEVLPVSALELAHGSSGRGREAELIVGCPVRFGARENAVVAPDAILDARPRYADAKLHATLSHWLDDCVRVVGDTRQTTPLRVVNAVLDEMIGGDDADQVRVAERLGVARRTLQRHLAFGGVGFHRLRDLLRANVAVCLLSTSGDRFIDIAHRVGFGEQATFSRAVRRWTGNSPREVSRLFAADYGRLRRALAH